ncbi:MAG: nickel-dependent lactate racemase [Clostridia bacterium]|nr:nickel-dependent lactate racemase [Clostridia bacterium]
MNIELPYGREKRVLRVEDARVRGVLSSRIEEYDPGASEEELVERSLRCPLGSPPLSELARGKKRVAVIASDHTRPVPSRIIMPRLLREIRRGNPDAEITILVATGCHRSTTPEELKEKFGPEIASRERIRVHDCDDENGLKLLGRLPSGGECRVNRIAAKADLLVAEGFIEPHFFAGFSGGRKSVLPGVASRESVLANHCSEFIAHPRARAGSLDGNPIHRDMVWAAEKAGLRFILNVVLNGEKRVIHAAAGDPFAAHEEGCSFLDKHCGVEPALADIVVTTNGGHPLDQNIYQAVKGMTAAEATVKPGGVIVMLARSGDGHGGEAFCREMTASGDLDALMQGILRRGRSETLPDQWQAQIFIRVLQRARVVYVSEADDALVKSLHMHPAHSLEEAMELAGALLGRRDASVTVIPDGVSVIVRTGGQRVDP